MPDNSNKIVLIVEDIDSNHLLIERSLAKIGISTLWATNGADAVTLCTEFDNINLVLMDLRLPKMDGYEATRQIRKKKAELPIIAQTAYVMPYEKSKVLEAGCTDLITKPFRAEDIIKIVEQYI
jgi:CheY-like chemotaxis protein